MAKTKEKIDETLGIINSALTILNKYPALDNARESIDFQSSINPLSFLMKLFKSTSGYNFVIKIIARFVAYQLPVIENAIKALLLAQLKDMLSCSVNPLLAKKIIKEGIVFNINEIDVSDLLKYSPFDKKVGNYFYFGTEGARMGDLKNSRDMNAFIWCVINESHRRYSWKPLKNKQDDEFRDFPSDKNKTKKTERDKKSDGILTVEYKESSSSLKDAEGKGLETHTPYNNCLHVFIGDARENFTDEKKLFDYEQYLEETNEKIKKNESKIDSKQFEREEFETKKQTLDDKLSAKEIDEDTYKREYNSYVTQIEQINKSISGLENTRQSLYEDKRKFQTQISKLIDGGLKYWEGITKNYYYHKPLIKFNYDYIASLRLFDEKVLAAKLLDSITGILTIDMNLSFKQQLIREEVKKMVKMVIETDDAEVSDCFFTFTNDDYDAMSRKAELRKAGLLTLNGEATSAVKVNAEDILYHLNNISASANKEEIENIIEGGLIDITKELSNVNYTEDETINGGVRINIIENLLSELAYVMVSSVLSPKIYLLLLINLKVMGAETNLTIEQFIGNYRQLFVNIVRAIRDAILEFFVTELKKQIEKLADDVRVLLTNEQVKYYTRLIMRIIECFKSHGDEYDFNIDDVDYADIITEEAQPLNSDC